MKADAENGVAFCHLKETEKPLIDKANSGFTNECGYGNKICHIKNNMGLWLLQETRRQWKWEGKDVSFDEMEKAALSAKPFKAFIDPEDPMFEAAGNMPQRVLEYCKKQVRPCLTATVKFSAVFTTALL